MSLKLYAGSVYIRMQVLESVYQTESVEIVVKITLNSHAITFQGINMHAYTIIAMLYFQGA